MHPTLIILTPLVALYGNMLRLFLAARMVMIIKDPFLIGFVFLQIIMLLIVLTMVYRKFLRFIIFMVYVGGLIVLLSYCLMLRPTPKLKTYLLFPLIASYFSARRPSNTYAMGISYGSTLILLGLLLLLVMVCVVEVVDYSSGMF